MKTPTKDILFEAVSPLGKTIRVTTAYWRKIISVKHPVMAGKEALVQATIECPEQIRMSKSDPTVFLYYRQEGGYFIAVVAKHLNGDGFIVTTYLTDRIKEGTPVWLKSR